MRFRWRKTQLVPYDVRAHELTTQAVLDGAVNLSVHGDGLQDLERDGLATNIDGPWKLTAKGRDWCRARGMKRRELARQAFPPLM